MEHRQQRDLALSEVGVGAYALGGAYGPADPEAFTGLLRRAHDLGVTFFDTAGSYGDAEVVLGAAVRPFRDAVIIATKVGSPEGAPPRLDPDAVRASCRRSLERLGTDRLDLLQVHFDDPATPVEDTVGALEGLQKEGLIRHYGVGHLPAARVARYLEVGTPFSVLMELSAAARDSRHTLLPLCGTSGPAAIAFSVTGRGLLTGAIGPAPAFPPGDIRNFDPLFQRARFASGRRVAAHLAGMAQAFGRTPSQMAVAWVLAQPGVACALTGPRRVSHLEENLGGSGWRLTGEALAELESLFAHEEAVLAAEEAATVDTILGSPLPADPAAAFRDLVYAIETAVSLGRATEDDIRPVFFELWPLQEQLASAGTALEAIRVRLRGAIAPTPQGAPAIGDAGMPMPGSRRPRSGAATTAATPW